MRLLSVVSPDAWSGRFNAVVSNKGICSDLI